MCVNDFDFGEANGIPRLLFNETSCIWKNLFALLSPFNNFFQLSKISYELKKIE